VRTFLVVIVTLASIGGLYFVLAAMWWLSAEPCRRCGKQHWSYDTARRCRFDADAEESPTRMEAMNAETP
jgi:hypothetical protein